MKSIKKEYDDLTAIKGIGLRRQGWLRESFGVCTFQDLASLSVNEIETRLKAEGIGISRKAIEVWIDEAKELAETPSPQRALEPAGAETSGNTSIAGGETEWNSVASFRVNFQTRQVADRKMEHQTKVHHIETSLHEKWSGIQAERLSQWILDRLNEEMKGKTVEEPSQAEVVSTKTLPPQKLEVTQVRVFQPPKAEMPIGLAQAGQPFSGMVQGDQPFTLQAGFEIDRPSLEEAVKNQVTYKAQFHIRNRSTGSKLHLGDTEPDNFVAGRVSYETILPEVHLHPGQYSLEVLVTIQSRTPSLGYLELPLLQVV